MKLIKPYTEILTPVNGNDVLKTLEKVARTCYKSEDKITEDGESAKRIVKLLLTSNHEAMLEFFDITVKFVCDRGISHEIVRHRIASFAQESTRYCNYTDDKFGKELTLIAPNWLLEEDIADINSGFWGNCDEDTIQWANCMQVCEDTYNFLISCPNKWKPEEARSVLPNSLKTEINVKMNLREWRHFFKLRTALAAHPQMRELTIPLLAEFKVLLPLLFEDL
jgi:thymidylate synthase (FAD)